MGSSTIQYGLTGRWVRSREITYADTGTTVAILDVPAGTLIPPHGAVIVITTLWSGGSPSLDIGDGTTADGWIDSTAITEGSTGTYADVDATYAVTGKYYASADTIDAVVAASSVAGAAYVYVYMLDVEDVHSD